MNTSLKNEIFSELFKEDSEKDKEDIGTTTLHLDFLDQIEDILTKKGYTKYKDLADILGVKRPFVSQLRSGDKKLNMKMLYKIQKALGFRFKLSTNDKGLNSDPASVPVVVLSLNTNSNSYVQPGKATGIAQSFNKIITTNTDISTVH